MVKRGKVVQSMIMTLSKELDRDQFKKRLYRKNVGGYVGVMEYNSIIEKVICFLFDTTAIS